VKPLAEKLGTQTTRELYALSHFKFKQHLAFKTAEFGNRVIICNEAYTSKTCTNCGRIHPDLGADKIYNCICGICHDRDYNGARNIALRVLTYGLTHANHIN
jgi:putative transposase